MPARWPRRAVRAGRALALLMVTAGVACAPRDDAPDALTPYADAYLMAGEGLGDLRLGTTTLQPFLDRFTGGSISALAGDDLAVEVAFPTRGLAFLFALEGDCASSQAARVRQLPLALRDPVTFFAAHPACAGSPLHSISVAAAPRQDDTFFRGLTEHHLGLFSARADLLSALPPSDDVRGLWLAGASPEDQRLETHAFARGIVYYVGEATEEPARGRLVVTKMAVFRMT